MNDMSKMQVFEEAALPLQRAAAVQQTLPVFKPRWWFRADRLDARPVIWSLLNRSAEWDWACYSEGNPNRSYIIHKPSNHRFWVHSGRGYYRLDRADCGCTAASGFQSFQQRAFHKAFIAWRMLQSGYNPVEFAAHFVHRTP